VNTPFPEFTTDSEAAAELVFGFLTLITLIGCAWLARRERKIWPITTLVACTLASVHEAFNNVVANVAYPQNQHTAFTLFGREEPIYLVLVYACFFGFTPFLMWQIERGITRKQMWQAFAGTVAFAALFEPIPVSQEWWIYYGEQPLEVFGIPMWWWFANATVVMGFAVMFTLARRHLLTADWQTVLFIPFALVPLMVFHASSAFPVYAAISSDASMTLKVLASLLTMIIATAWVAVMARMVAVPDRTTQRAPDPAGREKAFAVSGAAT